MATTELYQLLKLPFLVEHFVEHKKQNKHITLIDFLYLHYANGNVKDADYEKDMKLPFKTYSNHVSLNIIGIVANSIMKEVFRLKSNFIQLKLNILSKESFFASSYHSNIWQPPKYC